MKKQITADDIMMRPSISESGRTQRFSVTVPDAEGFQEVNFGELRGRYPEGDQWYFAVHHSGPLRNVIVRADSLPEIIGLITELANRESVYVRRDGDRMISVYDDSVGRPRVKRTSQKSAVGVLKRLVFGRRG